MLGNFNFAYLGLDLEFWIFKLLKKSWQSCAKYFDRKKVVLKMHCFAIFFIIISLDNSTAEITFTFVGKGFSK
jgi:hypothetical protein